MKVVLVNVKYSPNLGDGVIAECLEGALRARLPDAEIVSCDLAGRTEFGENGGAYRTLAITALSALPRPARRAIMSRAMEFEVRRNLMPFYRQRMKGADIVLFGGGQLLADVNLNFPLKVAGAAAIVHEAGASLGLYGVGVGRVWSYEGAQLFKEAFDGFDMFWSSVRDALSLRRWEKHFANSPVTRPSLCHDAGILAAKTYGAQQEKDRKNSNRSLIGLCVTHPAALRLDANEDHEIGARAMESLFRDTARELSERGFGVLAFTNGAPEDDAFLRRCFDDATLADMPSESVAVASRPQTPRDLVRTICKCDGVIGHRLHALIVAYAYRVPHVGLEMNRKIEGFLQMTNRPDYLIRAGQFAPQLIVERMQRALDEKIDERAHAAMIRRADNDMDELAAAMRRAYAEKRGPFIPQLAAQ